MRNLSELLRPDSIFLQQPLTSTRRVMELLSESLAQNLDTSRRDVLDRLTARERLGSTAVGHGCAIPHCRIPDEAHSSAVILTLTEGIDFAADDGGAVDVFLGLAVPEDADEQHLHYLQQVASILDDTEQVQQLRTANTPQQLLAALELA